MAGRSAMSSNTRKQPASISFKACAARFAWVPVKPRVGQPAATAEVAPVMLDQHPALADQHVTRWLGGRQDYLKA